MLLPLAALVGSVSGFLLWITLQRDYWDYWLYPKLKAPDFYYYPRLRYTLFDAVLLLWCLDGLIASGLLFRRAVFSRSIAAWTHRAMLLYFVLFVVLILGGSLMLFARSHGF